MKWIPVSEKLPRINHNVLLSATNGEVFVGYRDKPDLIWQVTEVDGRKHWVYDPEAYTDDIDSLPRGEDCGFSRYTGNGYGADGMMSVTSLNYDERFGGVNAWMPLPKPHTADRKTEPSNSEKPNNCELQTIRCPKCGRTDYIRDMEKDMGIKGSHYKYKCINCNTYIKDEPTISKMEQVEDEPKTQMKTQNSNLTFEKRKCVDCNFLTYMFGKTWCNIKCENPHDKVCDRFKPKGEPQTDCAWK